MYKTSSSFSISNFRNQVVVWSLLMVFSFSFLPCVSLAQQPTATIKTLSGDVRVSGQAATGETVLSVGDTIQTEARASVVLELSDRSLLELGENTKLDIAVLSQTAVGARVSRMKLLWGRIRAFLSPQHQIEGSSFDIETPNALIGVKFSEPDIEVSYNLEKAETVGIAHTVELLAKNLVTDEKVLVPVGSSVIIIGMIMKVVAGTSAAAIAAGSEAAAAETATGIGTGTKAAIGAGAVAVAGGVAAVAASSGNNDEGDAGGGIDWDNPFTGTFRGEGTYEHDTDEPNEGCESNGIPYKCTVQGVFILSLTQTGTSVIGPFIQTETTDCCTSSFSRLMTGTVDGTTLTLSDPGGSGSCQGANCSFRVDESLETWTATLRDNGRIFRVCFDSTDPSACGDFIRQ